MNVDLNKIGFAFAVIIVFAMVFSIGVGIGLNLNTKFFINPAPVNLYSFEQDLNEIKSNQFVLFQAVGFVAEQDLNIAVSQNSLFQLGSYFSQCQLVKEETTSNLYACPRVKGE